MCFIKLKYRCIRTVVSRQKTRYWSQKTRYWSNLINQKTRYWSNL